MTSMIVILGWVYFAQLAKATVMVLIRILLGQNQSQQNDPQRHEDQQQRNQQQRNHSNQLLHLQINLLLLRNGMDQNQHKRQNHFSVKLQVGTRSTFSYKGSEVLKYQEIFSPL